MFYVYYVFTKKNSAIPYYEAVLNTRSHIVFPGSLPHSLDTALEMNTFSVVKETLIVYWGRW